MIIDTIRVLEDWATAGHRILIVARAHPGARRQWLCGVDSHGTSLWKDIPENIDAGLIGIPLPEGVLDGLAAAHLGVAAPTPATERHLLDAIATRDRLLTLVETGASA